MKKKYFSLNVLMICLLSWQNTFCIECNIRDFGAVTDTSLLSTGAIQKAIDACFDNGGGRVIIPTGTFKTGSIFLRSNVALFLEPGAILYGSPDIKDYKKVKTDFISLRTQDSIVQLIYGEHCNNVSIGGYGEIDGQGKDFPYQPDDEGITRPHLIRFINCTDVRVENISLRSSGCWMQHYLAREGVQLHGLRIFNRIKENNDMLDIDGCRNVTVSDLISDTEDDGITLKSTSGRVCENVTITNCVLSSRWQAIKMGTESSGGFKNISITNCVVKCTNIYPWLDGTISDPLGAICLIITDGGTMENIMISNISIDNSEAPIYIRLANRARSYDRNIPVTHMGVVKDISIDNIRITNGGKKACSITGQPGHPIENVRFSNIVIESTGEGTEEEYLRPVPEDPKAYPAPVKWGNLPAYAFFIRHASNITFDGIELRTQKDDFRPAFYLDDVQGAHLMNMQVQGAEKNDATIFLKQSRDILIQGNSMIGGTNCFVKAEGCNTSGIYILNNLLQNSKSIFAVAGDCVEKPFESGNIK